MAWRASIVAQQQGHSLKKVAPIRRRSRQQAAASRKAADKARVTRQQAQLQMRRQRGQAQDVPVGDLTPPAPIFTTNEASRAQLTWATRLEAGGGDQPGLRNSRSMPAGIGDRASRSTVSMAHSMHAGGGSHGAGLRSGARSPIQMPEQHGPATLPKLDAASHADRVAATLLASKNTSSSARHPGRRSLEVSALQHGGAGARPAPINSVLDDLTRFVSRNSGHAVRVRAAVGSFSSDEGETDSSEERGWDSAVVYPSGAASRANGRAVTPPHTRLAPVDGVGDGGDEADGAGASSQYVTLYASAVEDHA